MTDEATPRVRLSRAAFVVLNQSGLGIWSGEAPAPLELELPELLVLQSLTVPTCLDDVLDELAPSAGAERARIEAFVQELDARGFLVAGGAASPVPQPEIPARAPDAPSQLPHQPLQARSPLVLRAATVGFECLDHGGEPVAVLRPDEVAALACFPVGGATVDVAHDRLSASGGGRSTPAR